MPAPPPDVRRVEVSCLFRRQSTADPGPASGQDSPGGGPRRGEARRRGARGGGRQDGVVALLEQLQEAVLDGPDARAGALVVERPHLPPARELRAQRLGQAVAARLPLPPPAPPPPRF